MGSTVGSNAGCDKGVRKSVQAGWSEVSEIIFDKRIEAKAKERVYKRVVRPAMLYGLERVELTKRHEAELEVTQLKMLRFSLELTMMDRIRKHV